MSNVGAGEVGMLLSGLTTGTIDYPSTLTLRDAEDIEPRIVEGDGYIVAGSKSTTGFGITVTTGTCKVFLAFQRHGLVSHMTP